MIIMEAEQRTRIVHNEVRMEFDSLSENEAFARNAVASFVMRLDPTMEELSDIKTAVSEAVTNAILHGYEGRMDGKIQMNCKIDRDVLRVEIKDKGKGIPDIKQAMEPLFTTRPELERSGMGFAFMEAFMDDLEVLSEVGEGTTVIMLKKLGVSPWI